MSKLTKRQQNEIEKLAALPDEKIDVSDIPEQADWETAVVGKFYRPIKHPVTMRLDADIIAWFRQRHPKYQTAINRALREYMHQHPGENRDRS
ncbi:MAG: BrnA antitoxin family protein [Pseudomonadota bacterium]|nr:BrnA antitoxin family protein [Pseudomonadota bacterium]